MKDLSPEERLLRLIKNPKKEEPKEPAKNALPANETAPKKPRISLKVFLAKSKQIDSFKIAIILLAIFFIITIFYFSVVLFGKKQPSPIIEIENLVAYGAKQPEQIPQQEQEQEDFEEEPFEKELAQAKNIFGAPVTRETVTPEERILSPAELMKDLTLLGVITGDNPQAIIEDKKLHKTFYIYEGETISQFKIKKIEKATVILEYDGETLKLSL